MRIGVIATEFPPQLGGMAEFARGLLTAMAQVNEVHVYTLRGHDLPESTVSVHHVLTGRPWVDRPTLLEAERDLDRWLALNSGLTPLAGSLRRPFFCYAHGNDFVDPWLPCGPRLLELIRRPYVARIRHGLRRRSIRTNLSSVRQLFVISQSTASLARRHLGVDDERMTIIPPGVADGFFQDHEPVDDDALHLLTVSRLSVHTRRKNVDGVLRAIAIAKSKQRIRYTVVGDGDDRPRLEALANDLGLADQVEFLGIVDMPRLLAAYRRSDLFIMASKATERDVEGFGIVYLEANASGVPVICSREGGATDAVADGRSGLLIDESSPEAIVRGIERFVRERSAFSPEIARSFADDFRWSKIASRVLRVIEDHSIFHRHRYLSYIINGLGFSRSNRQYHDPFQRLGG